jgi:hypothetical protein
MYTENEKDLRRIGAIDLHHPSAAAAAAAAARIIINRGIIRG